MPLLRSLVEPKGVTVVEGDALSLDWDTIVDPGAPWTLVANLPYNVATPLVVTLLETVPLMDRMLVMVQAEVGERLAAGPGEDAYGAVSAVVAYWAEARSWGGCPRRFSSPSPRWSRRWYRSRVAPAGERGRVHTAQGGRCGPDSASGARCCGARWPGS